MGSKGFGGGPRPLCEARRKEESVEQRRGKGREQALSCNLLLFQDPELPEGEALVLWAGTGSTIETEQLLLQPGSPERTHCSPHAQPGHHLFLQMSLFKHSRAYSFAHCLCRSTVGLSTCNRNHVTREALNSYIQLFAQLFTGNLCRPALEGEPRRGGVSVVVTLSPSTQGLTGRCLLGACVPRALPLLLPRCCCWG